MPGRARTDSDESLPGGALGLADPPPQVEPQFARADQPALHDPRIESPQPPEPDRTVPAILGAVGGAVLGAILWAAIGAATGYEIGWIAWGIGAGVGWCAAVLGGRGQVVAIACAVLTLAAIFGGKFAAVAYVVPREIESAMAAMISPAMYAEQEADAAAYAALGPAPSTDDVRGFMVAHGWSDGEDGWEVADEDVDAFKLHFAPDLVAFRQDHPTYEVWRDRAVDEAVGAMMQEVSTIDVLKESLSPIDFLWVLLGVSSAFGLIMRRSQD